MLLMIIITSLGDLIQHSYCPERSLKSRGCCGFDTRTYLFLLMMWVVGYLFFCLLLFAWLFPCPCLCLCMLLLLHSKTGIAPFMIILCHSCIITEGISLSLSLVLSHSCFLCNFSPFSFFFKILFLLCYYHLTNKAFSDATCLLLTKSAIAQ